MTLNEPNLNMTSTFLARQQQQTSSGDHAIMSMMSSRQHSKLTANIYGTQNKNVVSNVPGMMPQQQQQQQQFMNNGNNAMNSGAINGIASGHGDIMNINAGNNNIVNNSSAITNTNTMSSSLPQQQVQIAGLNGISFALPQPVFSQVGVALPSSQLNSSSSTIDALALSSLNGTVPEFLYQLTKMLTDEGNKEVIEWNAGLRYGGVQVSGRIEVHNPKRMEEEVLGKYFRHSKYASFQRQLNYFGFRKIAGKGKMSPCSYVNDMATSDIRSLLLIKRKGPIKGSGADEESTASSDNGKTCAAEDAKSAGAKSAKRSTSVGTKKRPLPVSTVNAHNIHQPVSVMAVGPPPTFFNGKSSVSTAFTGDHCKKVKLDPSSIDNQYINITDNDVFGFVANNNNTNTNNSFPSTNAQDSLTNAYNMALGQGVKHQFNNYLKTDFNYNSANSATGTIISNSASAAPSSAYSTAPTVVSTTSSASSTTHTEQSISNNNNFNSYLAYPSSQQAVSVPAPLQFLDPSELGMSIENSLNELKSNFNAANTANKVAVAAQTSTPSTSMPTYTFPNAATNNNPGMMSVNTAPPNGSVSFAANGIYFPNTPSMSFNAGMNMLSRDDSLVNLAMLPMMESGIDLTSYNHSYFNNGNGGGLLHRDDSLIELAASVDQTNNGNMNMTHHNHAAPASNGTNYGNNDDDGADTFSFIDFPGLT